MVVIGESVLRHAHIIKTTIKNIKTTNNDCGVPVCNSNLPAIKFLCFIYSLLPTDTGPWVFALCANLDFFPTMSVIFSQQNNPNIRNSDYSDTQVKFAVWEITLVGARMTPM